MSLKFTNGRAGVINYLGRRVTVWDYTNLDKLRAEFDNLGCYLDKDSLAWVGREFLVYGSKVVGKTTPSGRVTWLDEAADLPAEYSDRREERQEKENELVPSAAVAADIDVRKLWESATRVDWEAIMVKTSW